VRPLTANASSGCQQARDWHVNTCDISSSNLTCWQAPQPILPTSTWLTSQAWRQSKGAPAHPHQSPPSLCGLWLSKCFLQKEGQAGSDSPGERGRLGGKGTLPQDIEL